MSVSKNLQDIIIKQKLILEELEGEANAIASSDLTIENESLKMSLLQMEQVLAECNNKLTFATEKNTILKNALYEQVYSEKIKYLNASKQRSDIYFKSAIGGELNRLAQLERVLFEKADHIAADLKSYPLESANELYEKLNFLANEINELILQAKAKLETNSTTFFENSTEQYNSLKDEPIEDSVIDAIGQKNNLETYVGGSLINKLGLLFVVLGIIAVSRFTFLILPDIFKGIIMFSISGCFLIFGEFSNHKKPSIFSLGLTSGGVAGLYVSLSASYFLLDIISVYPALILCILITIGTFALSQRYNSQTIATFAMIGGYLPLFPITGSLALTYGAMIYFIILNLLALTFSFYKKWKVTMFIGYFLNLLGTIYIALSMVYLQHYDFTFGIPQLINILYVFFSFAVYTIIPVVSNYRKNKLFSVADFIVLCLNTFFSALIIYGLFLYYDLSNYMGLLAIVFALTYLLLGRFIETCFKKEKNALALFYLTGLTFVILTVPLQFDVMWLSLGWLIQGVVIAVYGILRNKPNFKIAGFGIFGLCTAAFLKFDFALHIDNLFSFKYFAITLGSLLILSALIYKKALLIRLAFAYKYAVLINIWFYSLYLFTNPIFDLLKVPLQEMNINFFFAVGALAVVASFLVSYFLTHIPIIMDRGVSIISVVIAIVGMLIFMYINTYIPLNISILTFFILFILCLLALLTMRNVLLFLVSEKTFPLEWLPFSLSVYFLILLSQTLIIQYRISINSILISIIYVVVALLWILYGFIKKQAYIRRIGLGFSIFAVAKLFLIDLHNLSIGGKIISYFAFGATLLAISYLYQYFNKRLNEK